MRLINIESCHSGLILGQSIYNEKGTVLLAKGTELTEIYIQKLQKYNIHTLYIDDGVSEGIDIIESFPEALRVEAINNITEGLHTIADLQSEKPTLQKMMNSSNAIRGFQKVFREILQTLKENKTALNLLASTKVYDNYLYTHSVNVAIYACQLALANGLPLKNVEEIGLGAILHDVGKLSVPIEILNKPGKLTNEEYEIVKSHSTTGFELLRRIHEIPLLVSHCALQHHERIDGKGYPRGLEGDNIHPYSKIISVADVFDAVTSQRTYRRPLLPHVAMELLYSGSGTQFDTHQVRLFKEGIAIYPVGITVKLNDGRTGIVSNYNYSAVGRPEIRIIKDEENQTISPYEIDLAAFDCLRIEIIEADALLY
ncbi:HD-GYP domain-containing protein [Bacillus sinesaloumensis]|uniref:HD-GYP domain-containing protein n=1 Tax=Litchfieldia sinesaloumensis TaxID=1926280 RepID=UPI0009886FFC|nr:HD-GYP domain-containing protein [Bacillus sinesaloumensis]